MTFNQIKRWYTKTSPKYVLGMTMEEAKKRREYRARVMAEAKTTANSVLVGLHRGRFGADLHDRLSKAIKAVKQ